MRPSSLIVVGASAGGVEALRDFVTGLPADLAAAVLIVLHMRPDRNSVLPAILGRETALPVHAARDGAVEAGHIYTAVPGSHLLVRADRMVLSRGLTENGHRPGVDTTFRSAAMAWGSLVAGVILSGNLDDGTAGLALIKRMGGLAVVQDPADAQYPGMPENALGQVAVDLMLPAREIGRAVAAALRDRRRFEIDAGLAIDRNTLADMEETLPRRRDGERDEDVERALWTALRALREKQRLSELMATDAARFPDDGRAERFTAQADEQREAAKILRKLLAGNGTTGPV